MWKAFWRVRAPQRGCSPQFIKTWSCEAPGTRQLQKGVLLGMVDFSGLDAFSIATSQKSSWMSCEWRFLTFMPWLQHFSAVWNGEGRRVATGGGAISKQIPWVCDRTSKADPTDRSPGLGLTAGNTCWEFAGHHAQESEPFWSVSWVKTKLVVFFTSFWIHNLFKVLCLMQGKHMYLEFQNKPFLMVVYQLDDELNIYILGKCSWKSSFPSI